MLVSLPTPDVLLSLYLYLLHTHSPFPPPPLGQRGPRLSRALGLPPELSVSRNMARQDIGEKKSHRGKKQQTPVPLKLASFNNKQCKAEYYGNEFGCR